MEQYIRTCPVCGIEFNARMGRSKKCKIHCSLICSNKSRSLALIPCPVCGKLFKPKKRPNGKRKQVCSPLCSYKVERIRIRGYKQSTVSWRKTPQSVIDYVCEHYPAGDVELIARHINRTVGAVQQIAQKAGVKRDTTRQYQIVSASMTQNNPMHNPEVVEKVRQHYRDNPEKKSRTFAALTAGHARIRRDKPTKPELRCAQILDDLNIRYEPQYIIKDKLIVDFRIDNLIIQIDGEYWHGHPRFEPLTDRQKAQQKRDKAQDKYLTTCGYQVVRVWERDVTRDNIHRIISGQ